MEYFEGEVVGYMLKQARMPFFVASSYSHHKLENGCLVPDNGPESAELRRTTADTYDLIKRIENRHRRSVRIPRTWVKAVEAQEPLVLALEHTRSATPEWCAEFYRLVRWLKSLTA